MGVLPLRRAVVGLVFVLGFLLIPAISHADTDADALGKWGVTPGQKPGGDVTGGNL